MKRGPAAEVGDAIARERVDPSPPGEKRCHQMPSITTTPGRVASVMRAVKRAAPRGLSTRTLSPSEMPRADASVDASIAVAVP